MNKISETIKNEAKKQKGGFLRMSVGTLLASILGNMLAGKPKIPWQGAIRASEGFISVNEGFVRAGEWTITAGQEF